MSGKPPARRGEFKAWRNLSTRWADNDVYGHVNNIVYYEWFDTAVNAWLIENAMLDVAAGDPIALVVETRCSYAAPLAFPQSVDAGLLVASIGRSSIRYRIGIFAGDSDSAAADGEFVHVVVDRTTRRPVPVPDEWRRKLEAIS
ncbi:MAG: acyl-CoA thioesterase [Sphingomicrobium sp.]